MDKVMVCRRLVQRRYRSGGGPVREVVLDGCGHGPPIERSTEVRDQLVTHIRGAA
jgi:pimeloyl-ACP methyl ester carboxylesterase